MTSTTDLAPRTAVPDAADLPAVHSDASDRTTRSAPHLRWSLATRVGFRFVATYFVLYVLCTQMFGALFGPLLRLLPFQVMPPMATSPVQALQSYIAVRWLAFSEPLSRNTGAGDKPVDYALVVGLLTIAAVLTAVWSAIDWKRLAYPRGVAWLRVFIRLAVATSLAQYGWAKAFPLQMPFPPLSRMLDPYGHFSLMAVLWSKIGSSSAYEIFTGVAELTAAVLLLIPGLTPVAALLSIAVTFQIWMLNMTYDVPVKLFSLHLLLMSIVLLLPDARRLVTFLVLKRVTDPPRDGRLFANLRWHRVAIALQVLFAAWVLWGGYQSGKAMSARLTAPKPPLYGIWNIDRMTIDGVERAPLTTDFDRWRRLVVQSPGVLLFQRMNDTWAPYSVKTDLDAKSMVVTTPPAPQAPGGNAPQASPTELGRFAIDQPTPQALILDGELNGRRLRLEMSYFDPETFRLRAATFHWVQDRPWNISSADYAAPTLK